MAQDQAPRLLQRIKTKGGAKEQAGAVTAAALLAKQLIDIRMTYLLLLYQLAPF